MIQPSYPKHAPVLTSRRSSLSSSDFIKKPPGRVFYKSNYSLIRIRNQSPTSIDLLLLLCQNLRSNRNITCFGEVINTPEFFFIHFMSRYNESEYAVRRSNPSNSYSCL